MPAMLSGHATNDLPDHTRVTTLSLQRRLRQRGQTLVLFAAGLVVLLGVCAIVIDVSWYWANSLRVQRAADAAALAGAVKLPGDPTSAYALARAEATKNGYTAGGGVVITPIKDPHNDRRLDVTISAPVGTFFMRVFGINTINATRTAKAEFTLPVPMGSPQNYYGVGLFVLPATSLKAPTAVPSTVWTNPTRANASDDNSYAQATLANAAQQWMTFSLLTGSGSVPNQPITGIEVAIRSLYQGSGTSTSCQLQAQLSWNSGTTWSPAAPTPAVTYTLTGTEAAFTFGSGTDLSMWTGHTWVRSDFADPNFRVKLTFVKPNCGASRVVAVDTLQVRVSTPAGTQPIVAPDGTTLTPQYFWGAMQSQGAPNIQGDAFMTKYSQRTNSSSNPAKVANGADPTQDPDAYYDPTNYYNYGIEIPAGSNDGQVWIFDPGFCEGSTSYGTGENWTVGGKNGNPTARPISAFFDLYDTQNTPYDLTDDGTPIATFGNTYRDLTGDDESMGGSNGSTDCSSATWHDNWVRLAQGLSGGDKGITYRLHTYSTDFANPTDQDDATGLNGFAIWAKASGGTPRVYGNGAMEGYFRLPGDQVSEFFLAQIDAVHAGKTMQIDLWDPGDTGALTARVEILQPTSSGWTPKSFTYFASKGSTDSAAVNCSTTPVSASSITTASGGTSNFNGCWIRIQIVLPSDYSAPTPPSGAWPAGIPTASQGGGWWRIRYTMTGTGNSTDLTTWHVQIKGNPVHLLVP
jgi:Flp pilus assembly protein TadG